ncbi:MAG: SMC family ATPase [Gordonia sp. (in: high G+C Gram-positive bacteria)]
MRLHRLRMRAFGPFADDVVIDFDALSGDGLFLLHGQTGAGKTTVLDAVAFALFGRVPGARQEGRRLHSDHAPAQQVPEVELEATLGGRRLRLLRSPEYLRPKKRGEGTTKVQAKAILEWIDGSGVALSRLPDIGEVIVGLLGMSADQFFQVVLLPQGDFAKFLRATNEDREALLERLFDTERFGGVEEWLRHRAGESRASLTEHEAGVDRIAAQIADRAATDLPADPDLGWAQERLAAARAADSAAAHVLNGARAEFEEAQRVYERSTRHMELRRRGVDARTRIEQLDAGRTAIERATVAVRRARQAAPIAPLIDDRERADAELTAAQESRRRADSECAELAAAQGLPDADEAQLDGAISRWTAESGRWEPLARRAQQRPDLVDEIAAIDREAAAAAHRLGEIDAALARIPQQRAAAVAAHSAAADKAARLPGLALQSERVERIADALAARDALVADIERSERKLLSAREAHASAREYLVGCRERRMAGMAAELAGQLVDGEPCAVCGSPQHPVPAAQTEARVTDADEVAAVEREKVASEERHRIQGAHERLVERRAGLDADIGEHTAEQISAERASVAAELDDAQRAEAAVAGLRRAVEDIDEAVTEWHSQRAAAHAAASGCAERRAARQDVLDALDADIAQATGGRVSIAQLRAELDELCRRATVLRDARRVEQTWQGRVVDLDKRLRSACANAGFESIEDARAAIATSEQLREWELMLEQAATQRAAADETLADAQVRAALDAEPIDLAAVEAAVTAARSRVDVAAGAHAVANATLASLEDHVAQFWAAHERLTPLRERHEQLAGLAELVSGRGQNAKRMTLRSYVLAARLEEVLVAASARLRQMSAGRYEFAHTDAVGPRGRRGGLGIEVHDEYTGAVRSASTLSGGETFFASLALALGLSDVVSAESGGRVLDTMFIDEGFGTLDPEALDLVMGVLDELRSGGRVVGVVSHVDELRARIPAQLEVLRSESGSTIRVRGALAAS